MPKSAERAGSSLPPASYGLFSDIEDLGDGDVSTGLVFVVVSSLPEEEDAGGGKAVAVCCCGCGSSSSCKVVGLLCLPAEGGREFCCWGCCCWSLFFGNVKLLAIEGRAMVVLEKLISQFHFKCVYVLRFVCLFFFFFLLLRF